MTGPPAGVPAPPNELEIEARVVSVEIFAEAPRRWLLEVEVHSSRSLQGPNFAHPGRTYRAFTMDEIPDPSQQYEIRARAEYVGDERGGALHLKNIEFVSPSAGD